MSKIGRNHPCPCGSGKKYKHCHGAIGATERTPSQDVGATRDNLNIGRMISERKLREQQQGLGKPIISIQVGDHRIVGVGAGLYHSTNWQTFLDFLSDYIKIKLGSDWGNEEIAKPLEQRHTLFQWYDEVARMQLDHISLPNIIAAMPVTGAAACYFGLAYNLYLMEHNVELQQRYLKRLRDPRNFQGTYYELVVAGSLIRAGYRLELENEASPDTKHCEFSAVSQKSGRKFWVEAKMRSVEGYFGKTSVDGVAASKKDPTTKLTSHVREALRKPANDERMIFVDLNAEVAIVDGKPQWLDSAIGRLSAEELDLSEGQAAYVFVTNLPFHRNLQETSVPRAVLAYGLGIPDFGKPSRRTLIDMYHSKRKHLDAYEVVDALRVYPAFPDTFDGSLISDQEGNGIKIGETYLFADIGDPPGTIGTVTTGTVVEEEKVAYVGITTSDGRGMILKNHLSAAQLDDYRRHPDFFFGEEQHVPRRITDPFELFEWLLRTYKNTSKNTLLELMKDAMDITKLATLTQEELALVYCERIAISMTAKAYPERLDTTSPSNPS